MLIFHVDVNSAYLSWTADWLLKNGHSVDIRNENAVIGADPRSRKGIVLAKSQIAKKRGVVTGEPLAKAREKNPGLKVYPPDYDLYLKCSSNMVSLLNEYSDRIERYSIDECFLEMDIKEADREFAVATAEEMKARIENELGFTVNIGISVNKFLAKMAGELKKPNLVHTLFPDEISRKLWPLPIGEMFMVGRASERKLKQIGIDTIGKLAKTEKTSIVALLKKPGVSLWEYANGIDNSKVDWHHKEKNKSIGHSTTMKTDVTKYRDAQLIMFALCEKTCMRLRKQKSMAQVVGVKLRNNKMENFTKQMTLGRPTDSTDVIYKVGSQLLQDLWSGVPIRQVGIFVSKLDEDKQQLSIFDELSKGSDDGFDAIDEKKEHARDEAIDKIREKFGEKAIVRGCFVGSEKEPIIGKGSGLKFL